MIAICIINKYGGLYVDSDIEPLFALKEYIEDDDDFVTCVNRNVDVNKFSFRFNPQFILSHKKHWITKNNNI